MDNMSSTTTKDYQIRPTPAITLLLRIMNCVKQRFMVSPISNEFSFFRSLLFFYVYWSLKNCFIAIDFFLILYTFQYLFSVLLDIFLIIWVCFILHDTLHIKRWGYYSKSSDFNNTTYSFCLFTYLLIYLLKMCYHLSNQTICSYLHKFCSFCLFF